MKRFALIEKAFLLKKTLPFRHLDLDILLAIADRLLLTNFKEKEAIFVKDEEATRMYFIAEGKVEIKDERLHLITILGPSDFFGEESLFSEKKRDYFAYSKEETKLLSLSRTHLHAIISECPSVAIGFLQVFSLAFPNRHKKSEETV